MCINYYDGQKESGKTLKISNTYYIYFVQSDLMGNETKNEISREGRETVYVVLVKYCQCYKLNWATSSYRERVFLPDSNYFQWLLVTDILFVKKP